MTKDMKQLLVVGGILGVAAYLLSKATNTTTLGDMGDGGAVNAGSWGGFYSQSDTMSTGAQYQLFHDALNMYGPNIRQAVRCVTSGKAWDKATQTCSGDPTGLPTPVFAPSSYALGPWEKAHQKALQSCYFNGWAWDPARLTCTDRRGHVVFRADKASVAMNSGMTPLKRRR